MFGKPTTLILLFSVLIFTKPAAAGNPYDLILEAQFDERFEREVEPHWREYGRPGSFTGVDGVEVAYTAFERENAQAAVVISSGRTESYLKYKELVYDLGRRGYSVYIHDHRGQGLSERLLEDDRHKGHVENFDDYVHDLHRLVTEVVKPARHQRLFLLGHSMGGGIATRYLQTHPDIFDAAALSAPMHAPNARILVSPEAGCRWFRLTAWICPTCYAGYRPRPYAPVPFEENEYTHSEVRYARARETYRQAEKARLGGPTRRWAAQACAAAEQMIDEAGKIRIPVLVLQAGADTAVTPQGQNRFCAGLKQHTGKGCANNGPVVLDNARHELLLESDEYRIPAVTAILDFFARQRYPRVE